MSQSYTILPFLNPPSDVYDSLNAVSSLNNNFSVSQSFNGIVNAGAESCASLQVSGASTFTGVCTFSSIPKFNAGVEIAISEVNTGTLVVAGQSTLNGGLVVAGIVELPAGTINQSEVQSGYVDLLNAQTVAGVKTFSSPPVASGASLSVNTVPALSIVNKSLGDAQLTLAGVGQTSIASGYVDLVNAQTVAGVKTFSSPPVASGASLSANTIPALSIVDKSIGDAQLTLAGVGQTSIASGYVDLLSNQSVSGVKSFQGACQFPAGLTALATTSLQSTTVTGLTATSAIINGPISANGVSGNIVASVGMTAPTFNGALAGNATSATLAQTVNILSDNVNGTCYIPFIKSNVGSDSLYVDDVSTPLLTYNPSFGLLSAGNLTVSGTSTLTNVILPSTSTACLNVSGIVSIPLGGFSMVNLTHGMTANIQGFVFTGLIAGARAVLVLNNGATARTLQKSTNSGGFTNLNSLAGNTSIAANSTWICNIYGISGNTVSMIWNNIT